ncbi:MAG: helix-turn-helix domain-containing protein [Candidatus Dormibacteraeota bacterium]|nr:helix-turn-helix domain-containing protein [Candidatus Dormibacteraeota bacterium]
MEEIGELRALANPTRLRILSVLSGGPQSAAGISRQLGIAHGSASFHLRQLAAAGVVRLLDERSSHGGRERRYTYDAGAVGRLSATGLVGFEVAVLKELRRRLALPRASGRELVSDSEGWVPRAEWDRAVDALGKTLGRLERLRRPGPAEGLVRASVTAMMFELAPEPEQA